MNEPWPQTRAVHVWQVALWATPKQMDSWLGSLDDHERARAARFAQRRDHDRYVVSHGALRRILASYLNVPPDQLRYIVGAQGKPGLAPQFADRPLRFNLAHSGEIALVAVAASREVGVDVEQLRPLPEAEPIAERHFSLDERRALASLSPSERPAAFFQVWTTKEAFIKATGQGLAYPLSRFSVPLLAGGTERPVRIDCDAVQPWAMQTLAPGVGYAGAVVAEGLDWKLELMAAFRL